MKALHRIFTVFIILLLASVLMLNGYSKLNINPVEKYKIISKNKIISLLNHHYHATKFFEKNMQSINVDGLFGIRISEVKLFYNI
jgi:hypothetical protein